MRVLIVEDDTHKGAQIVKHLLRRYVDWEVDVRASVQAAISALQASGRYDLVLLDMSLPVFDYTSVEDGLSHLAFGGRDVLDFIDRQDTKTPIIVITAFERFGEGPDAPSLEQLHEKLSVEYAGNYVGSVWFSTLEDTWQNQLDELIAEVSRRITEEGNA
jgi:CheY-like chemotaxis protein